MELFYPNPELTDGVVRLRRWAEDDLRCVEQASHDHRIPRGTSVPASFTVEEGTAFIHRQWSRITDGRGISQAIVWAETNRAIGLIWLALRPQPGVGGLGYWLVPNARGQRLAGRAVRLVTSWGLRDLHLARIEAWVEPDNLASQRTLQAAGFAREGVLHSFLSSGDGNSDAVVFSRIAGS